MTETIVCLATLKVPEEQLERGLLTWCHRVFLVSGLLDAIEEVREGDDITDNKFHLVNTPQAPPIEKQPRPIIG